MARKPRELVAGGVYHVFARGVRREAIFLDDEDRREYLSIWGLVARDLGWRCLAYCLMGNHVHHLVETPRANLSDGVREAHSAYARYFNEAHDTVGHLFERRYGASLAKSRGAIWYFAAYVALNPVRAGMCRQPEDHAWSSHGAVVARRTGPRWLDVERLLFHYGTDPLGRYRQIVATVQILGAAGFDPTPAAV
jgi:REP element-mobilizing transposase RayT